MRHASAAFSVRFCLLLSNLLPALVLPERSTHVTNSFCCSGTSNTMCPDDSIHYFRPIHFPNGALRRSNMVGLLFVDVGCWSDLHIQPQHTYRSHSNHSAPSRNWCRLCLPTDAYSSSGALHQGTTCCRYLQPELPAESWWCGWTRCFCCRPTDVAQASFTIRFRITCVFFILISGFRHNWGVACSSP